MRWFQLFLRIVRKPTKAFIAVVILNVAAILGYLFYLLEVQEHQSFLHFRRSHLDLGHIGIKKYPVIQNFEDKDWHDWNFIKAEKLRKGLGENGAAVKLGDPEEIILDRKLSSEEGLSVVISDKISVNRSVPDSRPAGCDKMKYFKNLPSVSVIIIFYNEWLSVLLRTIHSVYNRTPSELLKEIILVNDNSSKAELHDELVRYLKKNFDDRVKFLKLNERKGLIVTRLEGAKLATSEVLVFLDSHVEVNVNWLPPLLQPIAISPTTVTTPTVDNTKPKNFEYVKLPGTRGVFDEFMWYQWFQLRAEDNKYPLRPHQIPIMLGCAFAIRRDFFYDIGQYEDGLMIWNGEQIELSLKLHLCGGELLEVPCSRVGHTFRTHQDNHKVNGVEIALRNFKRVAEVWMDDYKQVVYNADPENYLTLDPGDLTKAKYVKSQLNCKPFQYFIDNIAPEMYTNFYYQKDFPGYFAWGAVRNLGIENQCIDFWNLKDKIVQTYNCSENQTHPHEQQFLKLTFHRKLKNYSRNECFQQNRVLDFCNYDKNQTYQDWKYDLETKQLISLWKDHWCLAAKTGNDTMELKPCDKNDKNQQWVWGNVNETALRRFDSTYWKDGKVVGYHDLYYI